RGRSSGVSSADPLVEGCRFDLIVFVASMDGDVDRCSLTAATRLVSRMWRSIDMANFLLTFHGGSMPETKEEQDQVMTAWTKWLGALGDKLVDRGNPISNVKTIAPGGSVSDGASNPPSGYTIIKADSLDDA